MVKPYTHRYDWPVKDRPNATSKIPYAYMEDPENPLKLIPDPELIPHIERALQYINDGNSIRSVSQWLSQATKKTITHQGMDYIWELKCGSDPHNPIVKERRKRRRERAPKTEEAKEQLRIKKELSKAKAKITREQKKLEAVQAAIAEKERLSQIEPEEIIYHPFDSEPVPVIPPELENREIAFTPNPGPQTEFLAAPEREVLYGGAAGGGKGVPKYMKVLTNFGWKEIGSLKLGDKICATDGTLQKIIGYHERGVQPMYKLTWSDRETTVCDADHIWVGWFGGKPTKRSGESFFGEATSKKITTQQIAEYYTKRNDKRRFTIPLMSKPALFTVQGVLKGPSKFIKRELPAYTLGVLLGDGCITTKSISFYTADAEITARVQLQLFEYFGDEYTVRYSANKDKQGGDVYLPRSLSKYLADYELLGTYSHSKFIPRIYKLASVDERWDLVRGLMDTDGWAEEDGNAFYTTVSETLRDDFIELVRSLGCLASYTTKYPTYTYKNEKKKGRTAYTIRIKCRTPEELFTLERKKARVKGKEYQSLGIYLESIELVEPQETVCITVSHPNSLFIIDKYRVTHNSYALLADPMRYFDHPAFRGLILRRTNDELRELKWKSKELYSKTFPDAKWKEQMSMWVFPSGAELWMTYLERDDDVLRYQGQAFSYIAIDELTQYATPFAWDYMRSRLRTTAPDLPIFMRATSNPGGPGHLWVKKMFVDPAVPGNAFPAIDIETGEVLKYPDNHHDRKLRGLPLFNRRFIPAKLSDNPYLMKGGEYEANLLSLPEAQRRKLLDGDWAIIEGAAFPEFSTGTHVIEPYKIPSSWRKFRSADFGYSSYSAVHWFAIDPIYETLIVYRELYVSKTTAIDLAQKIKQIETEADERVMYGVLDSSTWHQRGHNGPSIAEEMIGQGVSWRPSDRTKGSRTAGFNRLHELFKTTPYSDGKKMPGIVFFNNCRQVIADLQVIPVHPDGLDDIDDKYTSDHTYDSIRYGIMSRPRGQSPWDFEVTSISAYHSPVDRVFGY